MSDTTLDDIEATMEAQTTEIGSLNAFIVGIQKLLGEALYSEPISPAGNGKLKRIFASLNARESEIVAALVANTPSSPAKVGTAVTSITVKSGANPGTAGTPIVLGAVVTQATPATPPVHPTGTVEFMDGHSVLGTAAVAADGTATFDATFTLPGTYEITAIYSGDAINAGLTSAALAQVVS